MSVEFLQQRCLLVAAPEVIFNKAMQAASGLESLQFVGGGLAIKDVPEQNEIQTVRVLPAC